MCAWKTVGAHVHPAFLLDRMHTCHCVLATRSRREEARKRQDNMSSGCTSCSPELRSALASGAASSIGNVMNRSLTWSTENGHRPVLLTSAYIERSLYLAQCTTRLYSNGTSAISSTATDAQVLHVRRATRAHARTLPSASHDSCTSRHGKLTFAHAMCIELIGHW